MGCRLIKAAVIVDPARRRLKWLRQFTPQVGGFSPDADGWAQTPVGAKATDLQNL